MTELVGVLVFRGNEHKSVLIPMVERNGGEAGECARTLCTDIECGTARMLPDRGTMGCASNQKSTVEIPPTILSGAVLKKLRKSVSVLSTLGSM